MGDTGTGRIMGSGFPLVGLVFVRGTFRGEHRGLDLLPFRFWICRSILVVWTHKLPSMGYPFLGVTSLFNG